MVFWWSPGGSVGRIGRRGVLVVVAVVVVSCLGRPCRRSCYGRCGRRGAPSLCRDVCRIAESRSFNLDSERQHRLVLRVQE